MSISYEILHLKCWQCGFKFPCKIMINDEANPYVHTSFHCPSCDSTCQLTLDEEHIPMLLIFKEGKRAYMPDMHSLHGQIFLTEKTNR